VVTTGTLDPLRWQRVGDFYDAQAHSLLHGHLTVDPAVLANEAFTLDGRSYMYQGPVPALLRMPIAAVFGNRFDGRLTQLSILLGLAVALWAVLALHWRVRGAVRGTVPVGRTEGLLAGVFMFLVAGGSALAFQASRAWVYDEAIVWGVALTLGALVQLLRYRQDGRGLLACTLLTTGALFARASVGVGPLLGLAMVAALALWSNRRHLGRAGRDVALPAVAALTPLVLYMALNLAKFGTLLSVPFADQRLSVIDPARQAFLRANGGTLFGLQFLPTTVLHYLRPDGLRLTSTFPFVDFPAIPGRVIGAVTFDLVDRSASAPASMPFFVLLGLVGGFAVLGWSYRRERRARGLGVVVLAAGASALTILPFGYVAERYLGDVMPLLVVTSAVGLQVVLRSWRGWREGRVVIGGLLLLALATAWINIGLSLRYQREWSPDVAPAVLAGFAATQHDVADVVGHGAPVVMTGASLPTSPVPAGTLFALGDCVALYRSDGLPVSTLKPTQWNPVEGSGSAGWFDVDATFPDRPAGTQMPILTLGQPGDRVVAVYLRGGRVRFDHVSADGSTQPGRLVSSVADRTHRLRILADWRIHRLTVQLDDRVVLEDFIAPTPGVPVLAPTSTDGAAASFPGSMLAHEVTAPLCRRLTGRTG
jgi:hypothetical protein